MAIVFEYNRKDVPPPRSFRRHGAVPSKSVYDARPALVGRVKDNLDALRETRVRALVLGNTHTSCDQQSPRLSATMSVAELLFRHLRYGPQRTAGRVLRASARIGYHYGKNLRFDPLIGKNV